MNVFKNLASLAGGMVGRGTPQNPPGQMGGNPWWMPAMDRQAPAPAAAGSNGGWWQPPQMPKYPDAGLMPAPAQGIGWGQSPDVVNAPIDAGTWPGAAPMGDQAPADRPWWAPRMPMSGQS